MSIVDIRYRIDVAAGRKPADLLIKGGKVVSVLADRIVETDIAIAGGVIVGFGDYKAKKIIDVKGGYISAGLIDSHIHIESTLLSPWEFARTVVPHGTTSVVADPHEIANVLGEKGIRWMIKASDGIPIDINIVLPSCVPASKFESSGAILGAEELKSLVSLPRVIGIGEVMDFPGVIASRKDLLDKIRLIPGMRVDGHAPGLTGKDLYAYIAAGIHSDHESTSAAEAREKLMAGLHIMVREGTNEKNLKELATIITPANSHRCFFCSDDRSPRDLLEQGHIDQTLRLAVKCGIPPVTALQMATNNAPYYFRLPHRIGAVAIGYIADLVVFDSLHKFDARLVFKSGKIVARDGELTSPCRPSHKPFVDNTLHIGRISSDSFKVRADGKTARVIKLVENQITTRELHEKIKTENGLAVADTSRDILKIAVIERHFASGRISHGFVNGFGLKRGALASTVCHDSHNLIVVGTNDDDMCAAAHALSKCGGGFSTACDGNIVGLLPLPIAGLMSDKNAKDVSNDYAKLEKVTEALGPTIKNPFLALSFLALSVVPELRITDKGIVDSKNGKLVSLFM